MRLSLVVAALVAAGGPVTRPLGAQDTLRVLRHTPGDSAAPSSVVTITFDRPIAGALDTTRSPRRLFHITPEVPGSLVWRDPITIRFIPSSALASGTRYTVTVDTGVHGEGGASLPAPYGFSFRVVAAKLLARSFDHYGVGGDTLAPDGHMGLLYSAPVDSQWLRHLRIELSRCARPDTIALRATRQRPIGPGDPDNFRWAGGYSSDTMSTRLRTVVDVEPVRPLPLDCDGKVVIPTTADDSSYGREERYSVHTVPTFRILKITCDEWSSFTCVSGQLLVWFSVPVRRADLLEHVRLDGKEVVPQTNETVAKVWRLKIPLTPRTTYTISADTAIRDLYGRRLEGPARASIDVDDKLPQIMHAIGTITVPRSGAHTFPLRTVNVRSIRILAYRIPDSARVTAIGGADGYQPMLLIRNIKPETTTVALATRLNVDTTVEIPVPPLALAPDHPLVLMRVDVKEPLSDAHRPSPTVPNRPSYLRWPDRSTSWWMPIALVQVTDLAATARLLGTTNGAALVTGLGDGRPRNSVAITQFDQWGRAIGRGTTNRSGVATIAREVADSVPPPRTPATLYQSPRSTVLQAESGDDHVLFSLGTRGSYWSGMPLEPGYLGARADGSPLFAGAIFTERGIFRPGETVHLKGVVRAGMLGSLRAPTRGDSARITVRKTANSWADDSTQYIRDTVLRVSTYGTIVDSIRLRNGLPLGGYIADLKVVVGKQWRTIRSTGFRIAEYRAPEFLFDLVADTTTKYAGDTVTVEVRGRYLFGAPMRGAVVNWAGARDDGPSRIRIPNSKGWVVGDATWWSSSALGNERKAGVDTLDANGRARIRVPTARLKSALPSDVDVSAAVVDVNRQVVTAETSVPVNPSRVFILARTAGSRPDWRVNEAATVEFRTVDAHGTSIKNVDVQAFVVRNRYEEGDPVKRTSGRSLTDTVRRERIQATDGTGSITFTPTPGAYVVAFMASDASGAPTLTAVAREIVAPPPPSSAPTGFRLALKPEHARYKVGEEARVHFASPFADAEAWITVEREGILEQRRQRVTRGDNIVALRVSEKHAPNVFVSVVLLARSSPLTRADTATDRLRAGYVELQVARDQKMLSVAVSTDRPAYAPGDSVAVRLRVRDSRGRGTPSEVALWAADEGVLALTGFRTPDVLAQIYNPRGVGSPLWSSILTMLTSDPKLAAIFMEQPRAMLAASAAIVSASRNARGTEMPGNMRTAFASTAFYVGAVETNDRGEAVTRVRLPDNLTTFRVMAVAVSEGDRYGHGDTTLLVTRPLVARAALPRFVRPSDSLLAGVVVTPRDGKPRSATAEISATGLAIRSPARMSISLSGNSTEARFVVQAPARDKIGDTVTVRLGAADAENSDASENRLAVRPDYHPRTHAILGAVRDSQDVAIVLPADIDPQRSRMRLRIGTSPLSTMLAAYRWLRAYPYDCTEQLTSTGRALLAVWQATKRDLPDALGGDPRAKLQEIVGEIVRRQTSQGEFLSWPNVYETNPWLTAYAGMFLLDARDAGVLVDADVLSRAGNFLRRMSSLPIDTGGANRYEQRWFRLALGNRVAGAEYLRRSGAPDTTVERKLLRLASRMTWEDRLRLAEFLAPRTDMRSDVEAIVDAAWRTVTVAGHRVDLPDSSHAPRAFPSRVAPAARLLSASLVLRPTHPLLGALMESVIQEGRAESAFAWSTQDYAAVVLALARVAGQDGGDRVVRARTGAGLFSVPSSRVGIDTTIAAPIAGMLDTAQNGRRLLRLHVDASAGDKPIYYALEVEEIPLAVPVTPDIRGIVVERWYERPTDGVPVSRVGEGDLVRVKLRITVPADREFVAVEDPLPAGLEAVDTDLRTSATDDPTAARLPTGRDEREPSDDPSWPRFLYGGWVDGRWSIWQHKEIHDDRVSYFARMMWTGTYTASYLARATTAGSFVAPPAYAEEMYNPAVQGRTAGSRFVVESKPR